MPCSCLLALIVLPHSVAGLASVRADVASDAALYDLLKAAQARNMDPGASRQGRISFAVDYRPCPLPGAPREPSVVRVRGQIVWRDDRTLWVFRAQSPEMYGFGIPLTAELDAAPTLYYLTIKEKSYTYNPLTNVLFVRAYRDGRHAASSLLEVRPLTNWFVFIAPHHLDGRPWLEMIGPDAPAVQPEDVVTIGRDGDVVRQVRTLDNGSVQTVDFSLAWDGNVVRCEFDDRGPSPSPRSVRYDWARTASGRCVLKRCQAARTNGRRGGAVETYDLTIESVDLDRPVRASEVSEAALMALLPRDVLIEDEIADRQYLLNPGSRSGLPPFDRLAEEIAKDGFLRPRP